jgi:hypothetical protein
MIRIMMSTRERPYYTLKCIEALEMFTKSPFEIFLFDDRSQEKLSRRYELYSKLVKQNRIAYLGILPPKSQVSHNVFGKAWAWNLFGFLSTYRQNTFSESMRYFDWLMLIDNDILVRKQGWDEDMIHTWSLIDQHSELSKTVKVVTQAPGGIMGEKLEMELAEGWKVRVGCYGGSGFWLLKPNYFMDIGLLPLEYLIGQNKKHDQLSWAVHEQRTQSQRYIVGVWKPLALHVGHDHSVCNYLTTGQNAIRKRYEKEDQAFENMTVDEIIAKYDRREHQRW